MLSPHSRSLYTTWKWGMSQPLSRQEETMAEGKADVYPTIQQYIQSQMRTQVPEPCLASAAVL